ncbi:MAG: PhnD/SsuA/transferrin family substrate-binding protein, partial [Acidiferrobacterales bacterium]
MSLIRNSIRVSFFLLCGLFSAPGYAGLVLGAPPRESVTQADSVYVPIANFLTRITGQKVTYRYVDNWLSYQSDVHNGAYDIVFDGPAFIGWRMAKYGWTPLAKLPGELRFVVIVAKNNKTINNLTDLEGYPLCGFPPPNLA